MATDAGSHEAIEMTAPNRVYEAIKTKKSWEEVKEIVEEDETQCLMPFEDGLLPIHLACQMRCSNAIVKLLLDYQPKQQLTAVTESETKETVFHIAASDNCNAVIMRTLLDKCDKETLREVLQMKNKIAQDDDSGSHSRYNTIHLHFLFACITTYKL